MNQQQQKWAAIIVGIGGAVFCYFYFLYFPLLTHVGKLETNRTAKITELKNAKEKAKDIEALKKANINLEKELNFTRKRLSKTDDQPGIIKEISKAAAEKNVSIITFEFQKTVAGKSFYSEIPIRMTIRADFTALGEFLTKLGYSQRLLNCSDIQFSTSNNDPKGSTNTVVIFKTYVLISDIDSGVIPKEEVNERTIRPFYRYSGAQARDPFKSLSSMEVKVLGKEVNVSTLRLSSFMSLGKTQVAVFEDGSKIPFYFVGTKLYDKDRKDIIPNVTGYFEEGKVVLKQTDPLSGTAKETLFEITH
ncbi:MAG: type 4a pilus biogenesis protein PilO [Candidatus Firestonebacteria bacterium]